MSYRPFDQLGYLGRQPPPLAGRMAAFRNQPVWPFVKGGSQPHAETRSATDQPDRLSTIAAASAFPSFRTAAIAGICPLRGREPPVSQP